MTTMNCFHRTHRVWPSNEVVIVETETYFKQIPPQKWYRELKVGKSVYAIRQELEWIIKSNIYKICSLKRYKLFSAPFNIVKIKLQPYWRRLLDNSCQYNCVGYYNNILLYGWLLKRIYVKIQIATLSLQYWEILFKVFGRIAHIWDINRKMKH